MYDEDKDPAPADMCETTMGSPLRRKPVTRQRRKELLQLADSIAGRFDEVTDHNEFRILRRMVEMLVSRD